jgi:hypothetical protein
MDENQEVIIKFPPSGKDLRVIFEETKPSEARIGGKKVEVIHGPRIPNKTNFDELPDLIRQAPALIVSAMTADAVWETIYPTLIFVPDTNPDSVVRDATGRIIGVRRMILYDGKKS